MARQKSIIKLNGTLGDITFYRSRDGYMARERGGIPAARIHSDPKFQRTRENMAEFGRAGKAGKLLRNSIQALLRTSADPRMVSRLTQLFVKVIQEDAVNPRGLRNVIDGEAELLQGFEFNNQSQLSTTIVAPMTYTIDRATGQATVALEAYVPTDSIIAPTGSTHYQLVSAAMDVDFEAVSYTTDRSETAILPLETATTAASQLSNTLPTASTHPQFLIFGVNFYQQVNGQFYELKNGSYNALQIVKVSGTP